MVLTSFMLELFHFAVVSNVRCCFLVCYSQLVHFSFKWQLLDVQVKFVHSKKKRKKKAARLNKSELDSASHGLQRQKFVTQVKLSKNQMPKCLRERCSILLHEVFFPKTKINLDIFKLNSHAGQTIMQTVSHYCSITFVSLFSALFILHWQQTAIVYHLYLS